MYPFEGSCGRSGRLRTGRKGSRWWQLCDHPQSSVSAKRTALNVNADEPQHHGFDRLRLERLGFRLIEQRTTTGQLLVPTAIAEQAVMANPHEPRREYMQQKPSDELLDA